jgi:orotate phosphoribosyltransferase
MLSYEESLRILRKTNALLEGHFILSSGLHSQQYVQCAQLLSHPREAELISASLSNKIKEKISNIDVILSPAIGGIIIGYEVGQQLKVKSVFAERENKKLLLRRGFSLPKNSNVLIVEDVITTGKSVLECTDIVNQNEAKLVGYACIIDRTKEKIFKNHDIISQLKFDIKTYNEENLPKEIKNTPPLKPGSRNIKK